MVESLLHDTANIVIERTVVRAVEGHRSREMKIYWHLMFISMHISLLFFADSAETDAGWGGKLNGHLATMASCQEYSYKNLLKSDNPSWSYSR